MTDDANRSTTATTPTGTQAAAARGLVVVLNRDLFFGVRIADILRTAGYAIAIVPTSQVFVERLRSLDPPAVLGIVDLGAGPDWDLIQPLLADPAVPTSILAFGPHKDVSAMRAAKAAGVTRLVANSEFHRDLLGLVGRYAHAPGRST